MVYNGKATGGLVQHRFGAMRGDILRINICDIFKVSASYQS